MKLQPRIAHLFTQLISVRANILIYSVTSTLLSKFL